MKYNNRNNDSNSNNNISNKINPIIKYRYKCQS